MHILLVDDNHDIRHLYSMAFVLEGHRAVTASSGAEALELLAQHNFDVVILDIQMPQMSGWEVMRHLQQETPSAGVPVVILTAHDEEILGIDAESVGASALMRKPMLPDMVLHVAQMAVERFNEARRKHPAGAARSPKALGDPPLQ